MTTTFNQEELKTIKSLINLGDSKELAEKTVIKLREKADNSEICRFAYEN